MRREALHQGLECTTLRELLEMRYLWRQPVRMSNARLLAVLEREPHTPLEEAVEATLAGLGCLRADD
jgi:nucleoside-diphosphate-sugar epimerase